MRLVGFRIQMFKCVIDSSWVEVCPLTVLVGKNESGKTTLLKALHKFNPFQPEPYSIDREWPRGHRDTRDPHQIVCTGEFELSGAERKDLAEMTNHAMPLTRLKITKDYDGKFEVHFPDDVFPDRLHPNHIDKACAVLPAVPLGAGERLREGATAARAEAIRLAHEGRFSELASLHKTQASNLVALRSPNDQPAHSHEETFLGQYQAKLREIAHQLSTTPSIHKRAHEYVVAHLPVFVYMDEYQVFKGSALLDQVKQRRDRGKPLPEDATFLTILALSNLDLDREVARGAAPDRVDRQFDLSDASATLTRRIASHWQSAPYEVRFQADGQEFFTFVKAPNDPALLELEERSKGFQWFFSFDLKLMHETKATLKNAVLLLDEPGLHLHPQAQLDLLERLKDYAGDNTLIYTSHLPFMIDLEEPQQIRVLSETSAGTTVTEDLTKTQPDAKLVLQAALGISGRTSFLVAERNLVVEGVDDYWVIRALSNLLIRKGGEGLPDDVLITPAGGASEVTYIATFMTGQELAVVALYDTDGAGNAARDKLVTRWLTRYNARHATALSLGPAMGESSGEFSIEDLFPEPFYLQYVKEAYKLVLAGAGQTDIMLPPGEQLCKRVEAFLAGLGSKFNKGSIAKRICNDIRAMKSADALPPDTLRRAETLLRTIRAGFSST